MDLTSLTSVPTDSLYKFMALSGLIIFIISAVLPLYFLKNLNFQFFDLRKRVDILREEISDACFESWRILNDGDKSPERHSSKQFGQLSVTQKVEYLDALYERRIQELSDEEIERRDKLADSIIVVTKNITKDQIEVGCEFSKVEYLTNQIGLLRFIQFLGLVLGLALSGFGFYYWYYKIQVFIDSSLLTG